MTADYKFKFLKFLFYTDMKLTKEDVWGTFDENYNLVHRGMIVAPGFGGQKKDLKDWEKRLQVKSTCPVWKDKLQYKSVTVICDMSQIGEVMYWLSYVHGGGCISDETGLPGGKYAIRSNYMCW